MSLRHCYEIKLTEIIFLTSFFFLGGGGRLALIICLFNLQHDLQRMTPGDIILPIRNAAKYHGPRSC